MAGHGTVRWASSRVHREARQTSGWCPAGTAGSQLVLRQCGHPLSWCWVPSSRSHWSRGFRPVSLRRALLGARPVTSGRQALLAPRSSRPRSRPPAPLLARGPWCSLPDAALCKAAVAPHDMCGARSLQPGTVGLFSHWLPGGEEGCGCLALPSGLRLCFPCRVQRRKGS